MRVLQRFFLAVFVILPGLPLSACAGPPSTYSAEAIEAWVVDEDTDQPLEGVIVTANWQLYGGYHRSHVGQMMVMETVTDANGRFFLPAWGPKLRPEGYLDDNDPQLLLFKSGYKALGLVNELREKTNHSAVRHSVWHGKTIKVKKFEGSLEAYAEHLSSFDISLSFATGGLARDCEWKQIPRMLVAMHLEEKRFEEKRVHNNLSPLSTMPNQTHCGSAHEFFRSYLP